MTARPAPALEQQRQRLLRTTAAAWDLCGDAPPRPCRTAQAPRTAPAAPRRPPCASAARGLGFIG